MKLLLKGFAINKLYWISCEYKIIVFIRIPKKSYKYIKMNFKSFK